MNEERASEEPCPLLVRRATAGDGAAVAELLCQLGYPNKASATGARLERLARSADDYVLVAVLDQQIAGVMKLHVMPVLHEDSALGRLTALVVHRDFQRGGVGRRLVREAEAIARLRGCSRMEVTSAEHRTDAHKFYQHEGYEETSRRFIKTLTQSDQR